MPTHYYGHNPYGGGGGYDWGRATARVLGMMQQAQQQRQLQEKQAVMEAADRENAARLGEARAHFDGDPDMMRQWANQQYMMGNRALAEQGLGAAEEFAGARADQEAAARAATQLDMQREAAARQQAAFELRQEQFAYQQEQDLLDRQAPGRPPTYQRYAAVNPETGRPEFYWQDPTNPTAQPIPTGQAAPAGAAPTINVGAFDPAKTALSLTTQISDKISRGNTPSPQDMHTLSWTLPMLERHSPELVQMLRGVLNPPAAQTQLVPPADPTVAAAPVVEQPQPVIRPTDVPVTGNAARDAARRRMAELGVRIGSQ